ncbi:PAS domain S-box protein [Pontibacter silvestris]|uniref:histidine kinase n=1 Tax=Pontibacter silvestris TaxID=2305183 RepID=A0ABW4X4F6_9BACT|nr:PAS domain-containing sensor histidine kinase [Pontibacter silvestris]MCC9134921.1 PAS domain-containing sensor histidine kinase [Pontibacter silvestris]
MNSSFGAFDDTSSLLHESEERYRLLVDNIRDYAIFMLDTEGKVVTWNDGAKRIKGYEPADIIGKHFSVFYTEEDIARDYPGYELQQARKTGRYEDEGWRVRKDGTLFWANVIITVIINNNNEFIGFSKITHDLTERKKLQDKLAMANLELQENERRSRLLIESVRDYAILMLSPEGNIVTWNVGAERLTGYSASEAVGKHFSMIYSNEAIDSAYPEYELRKAVSNGRFEDEGWRIRKDGSAIWAHVVITPLFDSDNVLFGFTKITKDLSERRRNEELMLKNRELLRVNTDLDNFVYTASHDLKAPIANLEGLVRLLKDEIGTEASKYQDVFSRMNSSISRLNNVIRDLTEITKVQQQNHLNNEEVNIEETLQEIEESLEETIREKNAEIIKDIASFKTLRYSRKNFRSILYNLLSNALKYSSPGLSPVVTIKTEMPDADTLMLSVADNGLGFETSQKKKMFSMFKRMHTHVEGSGLGLYLVKRMLDNTGDRIEATSEVGKGAVFQVFFNLGKKDI